MCLTKKYPVMFCQLTHIRIYTQQLNNYMYYANKHCITVRKYYAGINQAIGSYTFRILINVLFVDSDGWYKMGLCNILTCHQVRVIHIAAMNCFCIWKYILFQENKDWLKSSFIWLICEVTRTTSKKRKETGLIKWCFRSWIIK